MKSEAGSGSIARGPLCDDEGGAGAQQGRDNGCVKGILIADTNQGCPR